ncbi:MAG: glycosyltransferase family 4 protein [Thermoanaerobaculales bacterium]|nr:glycosyltransferase family 4 protein [Thermoanaerobaculales bacterium]
MGFHLALDARKLTDFGIGTYVGHLLRGLAGQEEVKLTVLARVGHEERVTGLVPEARVIPVSAAGYSLAEHFSLPLALWREKIDLVHVPHYVVPLGLQGPVVSTVHDVIQLFYPPQRRTQLGLMYLRTLMNTTLRRSRRVITVSRTSRRDLIRLFGADEQKLKVVPNGVDPNLEQRPSSEVLQELKDRLGLRPPLVLVVANDKPHKNLDTVLRAFHLGLRAHGLPGQLVFVGGMEPDGRLARKVAGLGLGERVRFLGRVSQTDLHRLYHLSAALLHIALYEGFGLPILEAMLAGLPVITSNVGAMQELGEGVARLVNPLDVQEIARVLEQVLVDDPLRRRMVEAGRRRAHRMTWEKMVGGTMDVYREALAQGPRPVA